MLVFHRGQGVFSANFLPRKLCWKAFEFVVVVWKASAQQKLEAIPNHCKRVDAIGYVSWVPLHVSQRRFPSVRSTEQNSFFTIHGKLRVQNPPKCHHA